MKLTPEQLAKYFDHTALKSETTEEDIRKLCQEAKDLNTAAVCVNPIWIPLAKTLLQGTTVMPITVVGFPLGATGTATKVFESQEAIKNGAKEIDMVLSVGELKAKKYDVAREDIRAVKKACGQVPLKVIFETSLLTNDEISLVASWCAQDGVEFVKTSTGFGSRGASVEDVKLMKAEIQKVPNCKTKIKASGGIRNLKGTLELIEAGADRIGASASVAIMKEFRGEGAAKDGGSSY